MPAGPALVEQRRRERGAELDRRDAREDERDGRDGSSAASPRPGASLVVFAAAGTTSEASPGRSRE